MSQHTAIRYGGDEVKINSFIQQEEFNIRSGASSSQGQGSNNQRPARLSILLAPQLRRARDFASRPVDRAFALDPKPAASSQRRHRMNAAGAAALDECGQGKDAATASSRLPRSR
jgi:hypothetical protein